MSAFHTSLDRAIARLRGKYRAPKHRADRHEDSCSLACEAGSEGGEHCGVYAGRHVARWAA